MYEINKILSDSDLDGIVCAAILLNVYQQAEVYLTESAQIRAGELVTSIDSKTVISDLMYIEGCGLYFDHHDSNKPETESFPGRWQVADSASRIVYEYFKHVSDLSLFADYIQEVDKIDGGKISLADIEQRSPLLDIALSIDRNNHAINQLLVQLFSKYSPQTVWNNQAIKTYLQETRSKQEQAQSYASKHETLLGDLLFIDFSSYAEDLKLHSYLFVSRHKDVSAIAIAKPAKDNRVKIGLYRNAINPEAKEYDLLNMAKNISPSSAGGHKGACGFALPANSDLAKIAQEMRNYLDQQLID